jgi:serine/threonine protein kinase
MPTDPDPTERDDLPMAFAEEVPPEIPTLLGTTTSGAPYQQGETIGPVERPLPTIPGYEIQGEIGRGGVGVVYKARQTKLDRVVALKVLLKGALADDQELTRFRTEALTVAQLQHPNVIQVYDVGEHEGVPYIAVEYAGGGDLRKWLGKPLAVTSAIRLVYTLARAVGAAHRKRVVHRDLKPANILLTENGVPKIADFGIAKHVGAAGQTTSGAILGTPYYMSPEQAAGLSRRIGPPADVYALGVILYECLTGRVPFSGDTVLDTLDRVRFAEPIPVQDLRADTPPELAAVVRRCLRKSPEERYPAADVLADDLARVVAEPADTDPVFALPSWFIPFVGTVAVLLLAGLLIREGGLFERRLTTPTTQEKVTGGNPRSLPTP